ncbi:hypothetical protein Q31a_18640 [Aureliella helgolandensis]|uniref:Uncharacterized protein n=1 Tax=Aureliella helgolandensis TaxID=2527968 RepID=A0A518G4Q5_9BACT|nr:hypothetical protein Q31a_18640 [Aureliella helgolandensis]
MYLGSLLLQTAKGTKDDIQSCVDSNTALPFKPVHSSVVSTSLRNISRFFEIQSTNQTIVHFVSIGFNKTLRWVKTSVSPSC